jgi:hypothetical protein
MKYPSEGGCAVNKSLLPSTLLLIIIIGGFAIAGAMHFETVQAATEVIGIITSDTTWTKASSPYVLTGPLKVNESVALLIEPGTLVDLGSYYIQVDGILHAVGSEADSVHFNGGHIRITQNSADWSEQDDSGCVIENAVLDSTSITIDSAYPRIYGNSIFASVDIFGFSTISNNIITGLVTVRGGSPVISNNTLTGGVSMGTSDTPIITKNVITAKGGKGIQVNGGNGSIIGNTIYGCEFGILLSPVQVFGGTWPPYATVERNLIVNNTYGISIGLGSRFDPGSLCPTIQKNTIYGNSIGISLSVSNYLTTPRIANNNIQNNAQHNFYLGSGTSNDVDVTYNWWGTTDTQAINQTIFDSKYDFNLGTVDFVPFLTAPNPEAPSIPSTSPTSVPTPSPSDSSSTLNPPPTNSPAPASTPSQQSALTPEQVNIVIGVTVVAVVVGAGVGLLIYLIKRK